MEQSRARVSTQVEFRRRREELFETGNTLVAGIALSGRDVQGFVGSPRGTGCDA